MRQKSIRLPPQLDDELVAISEQEGVDQSELVRWGLLLLFRQLRPEPGRLRELIEELKNLPPDPPAAE